MTCSVGVDGDHIDVLFVGELIRLSSYYSGRWVSQYSIDVVGDTIQVGCSALQSLPAGRDRGHPLPLLREWQRPNGCAQGAEPGFAAVYSQCGSRGVQGDRILRGQSAGGSAGGVHVDEAGRAASGLRWCESRVGLPSPAATHAPALPVERERAQNGGHNERDESETVIWFVATKESYFTSGVEYAT